MKKTKTLLIAALVLSGLISTNQAWAEEHYVNGAGTIGWQSGNEYNLSPVAMVNVSENVWVWAGSIKANERFRITGLNYGGHWATSDGDVLGSEEKNMKASQDGGDFSFVVAEEGIYRVTADFTNLKIKAEKMSEPSKDGDYYLISSVNDYYWYAGQVTSTGDILKARLTADLDFSETGFFPLACDKYKFKGEFDGAGHTICNAVIIGSNNNVAFTRYATGGTNIHDLVIEGSFTGAAKVGGVIGFARDGGEVTLTNVINKATVHSSGDTDANAAGLVGCATDDTKITATNCANMGAVSGQDGQCAAFAGWTQNGTTFTNCWNSGTISNIESSAQLYRNSGSVNATNCFDLTNVGNQGTKVDAAKLSTGEFCYTLNGNSSEDVDWYQAIGSDNYPMPFQNGDNSTVYQHSSKIYSNLPSSKYVDEYFQLSSATDLELFAGMVNGGNLTVNGKLTADIDMTGEGWTPIGGEGHKYCGTFDGQGHMIDNLVLDNSGYDSQGIFGQVGGSIDADECIIKNLIAGPNNSIKGKEWVGGLIGCADGNGTIKLINCGQEGYVEAANVNAAAMIGCMKSCALYLENCYNIGNIKGGSESAIISGWLAGHKYHTVSGFYNTGSIEGQDGDHSLFRNQDGNNNWADIPYTDFTKYENVYHISADQGATPVTKDADNYYQIGDGKQLKWFAYWSRTGNNTTAKGKLTANIDMKDIVFPCIGSDSKKFAGELVGDGAKIISNLTINENGNGVGLIRVATDGAQVKNITTDFTCSFKGDSQVGAIIGTLNGGGDVYVENCGNEAPVEAANYNAGGLVGKAFNSTIGHFTNCYNVGGVKSGIPDNAAGLTFETEGAVFTRCYSFLSSADCNGLIDNKWFTHTTSYTASTCYGNNSSENTDIDDLSITNMADGTLRTNLGTTYYTNMVYGAKAHPGFAAQINIELREDAVNTLPNENMTSMNMKLYRSLTKETWNSICLPFDLDADGIEEVFGEGTKVAEFASVNGVNNDNLHFGQVTSISARTPYLIYPANNRPYSEPIVLSGITIQPSPATVTKGGFNFIGIYKPTPIDGNYFIASGNKIKQSTGGDLKAFRAYIESVAEARPLTFDFFDDVTTGVKDAKHLMNSGLLTTDNVYDLQGRRIANPTKGLYVVNGKKVVIK